MTKTMNIGIDHGYYAIKTRHFSFPAGISEYSHEPYTLQNTLEYGGKFYVCGTGRQPILRNKMDSCEEMMIQDWPGALYKKDDTAFLCWTYSPEVTYVLEYTPSKIDDSEIIKMDESAEHVK